MEGIELWIYNFIVHANLSYHFVLFENSEWILPFEKKEMERMMIQQKEAPEYKWIEIQECKQLKTPEHKQKETGTRLYTSRNVNESLIIINQ